MRYSLALVMGLASLLASCGGGSGTPPTPVSFKPSQLTSAAIGGVATPVPVVATVGGSVTGTVYPKLVQDKPIFLASSLTLTNFGNGTFGGTLSTDSTLAVGSYSGTLSLHLCNDPTCSSELALSGNTVPYQITVQALQVSFTTPPLQLVSVAGSTAGSPIGVSINPAPPSGAVVSIQASSPIFYQAPAGPSSSISLVPGATAGVFTSSNLPGDPARIYNNALLAGAQSGTLNVQVQCAYSPCASPGANLAKSGSNANYTLSVTPLVPTVTQNGHAFPNIGTVLRPAYQIGSQVSLTLNMPMPVTWGYSNTFTYCCSQSTSLTGALLSGGLTAVVWATPEASFLPNTGANPYQVNIDLSAPQ